MSLPAGLDARVVPVTWIGDGTFVERTAAEVPSPQRTEAERSE